MENNYEQDFYKIAIDILLEIGIDKKVEAIKILRERTGLALVEAKPIIDMVVENFDVYKDTYYPDGEEFIEETVQEEIPQEENQDLDYENMSIDELKEQLEKERLIAELKQLKVQNNSQTQPTTQSASSDRPIAKPVGIKTTQQRKKENKAAGIACCPKCGSTSIQASNKKLSVGRAIVGTAILPGVGTVLGGLSSKKTVCTCLNCGHKWKL